MPNQTVPGQLSDAQKESLLSLLNEKWKGEKNCPISKDNDWVVGDHLVYAPVWTAGKIRIGGPSYPMALLACRTCGYTLFFNAILAAVVEHDADANTEESAT